MDFNHIESASGARRSARPFSRKTATAAAALLLTGSLIGWTASATGGMDAAGSAAPPASAPRSATVAAPDVPSSYAGIVDHVSPAVVTVRSERRVRRINQDLPDDPRLREFFEQFGFGQGPRRDVPERRQGGLGSGVIVRADGYILTNNHVVDGAEEVNVELTDGRSLKAKVVGTDAPSDLAVLKIEGSNLQTLSLGDSDAVRVGDVVLAVGNPLGVGQTVTMGIVSAKGRATGIGDGSFEDFIQTDAPINQGNSGGALVNTRGELVGINSQILTPSGGNIGIGFAIPANMARNVMSQLIDHGEVRRGMLGVTIQPVTSDIARSLGLTEVHGALVNTVNPGSPAEKAGVRRGDVITAVNGGGVKDYNDLRNQVAQLLPGSKVKLTVVRDGKEQVLDATLAELESSRAATGRNEPGDDPTGFGMTVAPLTAERARELGVSASTGLVVTDVQSGSRAASAGLEPGDVIAEVDRKPVSTTDALRAALKAGTRPALLYVHRGDRSMFVTVDRG
ncbi:MAG: DegQ family serine endoprotease [Vicinamibacterales bacterium]